jgi:hypothetical protein
MSQEVWHRKVGNVDGSMIKSHFFRPGPMMVVSVGKKAATQLDEHGHERRSQINGDQKYEQFHVYEKLLCHHSPFFRKACGGPWLEKQYREVNLPDDDPNIFALLYQFVLLGEYAQPVEEPAIWPTTNDHIAVYILADKLGMPGLQDLVITYLIIEYEAGYLEFEPDEIIHAFNNTMPDSKLRKMLLYFILRFTQEDHTEAQTHWLRNPQDSKSETVLTECPDFYRDLAVLQLPGKHEKTYRDCTFHEHASDVKCKYAGKIRGWGCQHKRLTRSA